MPGFRPKSSRMLILLIAMAVLLPLLATLQYHWLGQVSELASERLQSSLRANAAGFRRDFNRELIRAYLNFQSDSITPEPELDAFHSERLDHWNKIAPYAQLIGDVFVVDYDQDARPQLRRLDGKTNRLELVEWSGEFAGWQQRFERTKTRAQLEGSGLNPIESFAEDIPGLIIPFPLVPGDAQPSAGKPQSPGFTIVRLDLKYLQQDFIPALVKHNLLDDSQYDLKIISASHPERVVYSSRYPVVDFTSNDASIRVFGFDSDELRSFLRSEGATQTAPDQPARVRLISLRNVKGPDAVSAGATSEENGHWQLLIKHQAGSLAASVSSARRRNLAISFGILLLLGAGIFMTAVSTARAERLARQQIDFVAGVTHELRTPLAVICSAGENLAHGIVEGKSKVAQYGEVIHREGRRLTDMVEQVLEFAGAESGRQRYQFRPTNVNDFIEAAVAACQTQIKERDFQLDTLIAPDLPAVNGDSAALRRALQNLISNAIKYEGKNAWGRIRAAAIASERGNEVVITVEDHGLGIDAADIPHIFEPFYRGQKAIAAQLEGSGVGLSLVKQIVEAHGGRITVKSEPGSGSAFTIHLPVANSKGS